MTTKVGPIDPIKLKAWLVEQWNLSPEMRIIDAPMALNELIDTDMFAPPFVAPTEASVQASAAKDVYIYNNQVCEGCGEWEQNHNDVKCPARYPTLTDGTHMIQEILRNQKALAAKDEAIRVAKESLQGLIKLYGVEKGVTFSASLDKTAPPAPPIAQDTMREGQPDPLADLVVGTIICPGVPEHEHKIYRSELFKEYQGTTASIQGLVDERNDWRAQALAHPTGQQEAALRDYTPEEALAEAVKRFGKPVRIEYHGFGNLNHGTLVAGSYVVKLNGKLYQGDSFKAAFSKTEEALSTPATQESTKQS